MKTMCKQILNTVIIVCAFTISAHTVFAAQIILTPSQEKIGLEERLTVDVLLDPEGEALNTIEATLLVPHGVVFSGSDDSASIITMWVKRPKLVGEKVVFSGIIPGGFTGLINPFRPKTVLPGVLTKLSFTAKAVGPIQFNLESVHAYLNDGNGTEIPVVLKPASIMVVPEKTGTAPRVNDVTPPEHFIPELVKNELLFNNRYALVFDTRDAESGVAQFEVQENKGTWIAAESPYLLTRQDLPGPILVRATDYAGNVRVESVSVPQRVSNTTSVAVFIICLIILVGWIILKRRRVHS